MSLPVRAAGAFACLLLSLPGVRAAAPPPPLPKVDVPDLRALAVRPTNPMPLVTLRFDRDLGNLQRSYTIAASPTRHARLRSFCADWLAALEKFDATRLGDQGKKDLQTLVDRVKRERDTLDRHARAEAAAAPLVPFAPTVIGLEEARRRLERVDSPRAARLVHGLSRQIEQGRKAAETARADDLTRAAETTAGLRTALRQWFDFYNGYDPLFTWWVAQPYREAEAALNKYAAFLRDRARTAAKGGTTVEVPLVVGPRRADDVPDLRQLLAEPRSEMEAVVQRYRTERFRLSPRSMAGFGPPRSAQGAARMRAFALGWLDGLERIDFDKLSQDGKIDYLLLRNQLRRDLRRVALPAPPPAKKDGSGIAGRPIGRQALLLELEAEMIPYSPEELIAIARRELAWCEAEMKKAAQAMGFGNDWLKAIERVKTLHVDPGRQPEMVRDLAREAIAYLGKHDLVSLPPLAAETWRMEMLSPERQLTAPFFLGGEVIRVAFPTADMPLEAKLQSMRGNNVHFSRATVHHELIPGHHLQGFMTARYRTHRGSFSTPFWVEGWALYWEFILYDRGFARTPEDRVGFLFWRMHRCARIIFSLGFHLGTMSPQECIDLLVNRVGHERANATAEVRRSFAGNYGPLYQAAYMLGGLQIRSLRRELVESGKMSERAFHDAILKENRIPIALVRASLTRQKLTRDYRPDWRFAGDLSPGR